MYTFVFVVNNKISCTYNYLLDSKINIALFISTMLVWFTLIGHRKQPIIPCCVYNVKYIIKHSAWFCACDIFWILVWYHSYLKSSHHILKNILVAFRHYLTKPGVVRKITINWKMLKDLMISYSQII